MKFFSLISGKDVRLSPEKKVVPKEEFSTLVSAMELLEQIKEDAITQRNEIAKEGEKLFEESKQKGFDEGMAQWADQLRHLETTIQNNKAELQKFISKIALMTTQKIIGRELKQDPSTLVDIIAKNLKSVAGHKKIVIFVSKDDEALIHASKERLKNIIEEVESFSIQIREDITEGGAIIETESGIIDARTETLWKTIERAFENLGKKPSNDH